MGKHNGRARTSGGLGVGSALTSKVRQGARGGRDPKFSHYHTTETHDQNKPTMQSIIENNDLGELLDIATLADRDFAGQRGEAVVISTGVVSALDLERSKQERIQLEESNRHRLVVPRRPAWTPDMRPDELDVNERRAFLEWRRDLAKLEEEQKLVLTPFEKNLEVWRQLWRVVERSDIVVQVVDSRDPMRYRCEDLEKYCMELDMTKSTILLLNKSDLLPLDIRTAWADFLDDLGVEYVFWSAVRAMEDVEWEKAVERATSMGLPVDPKTESDYLAKLAKRREDESESDARTRILDRDTLIELLEQRAIKALKAAGPEDPRNQEAGRRRVVGLIGYPNVGKSSTINALFGGKKTAVAPTPGKTKHFQTLIIHETMMFCDAPGLVFPTYAHSKAEMVAAGVIPIDRLTEVRTPVQIVASRVGRIPFERLYGCKFPPSVSLENPSAGEVLRGLCVLRGWVNGSGLPDETRGGRQILKDYCDGRLLWFEYPPGYEGPRDHRQRLLGITPAPTAPEHEPTATAARSGTEETSQEPAGTSNAAPAAAPGMSAAATLDLESALLMESLDLGGDKQKNRRPDYKFKKKEKRSKGTRGKNAFGIQADGAFDGGGIAYGKKGGILRVAGYVTNAAE